VVKTLVVKNSRTVNEDGTKDDDFVGVMGNPHPDFTWGWI